MAADARVVLPRVRRTLRERGLISDGARVVVACSGGPDSAALLFVLAELASQLRLRLDAASVDHGLRPNARDDVELARTQAERAGVAFHALRVAVSRDGGSLQAAARAARYEALGELAARLGASRIAVGHTQDDQAETVLQRVLRGAGLVGLGAIAPLRADGVVRPLIDCRRADVHAYSAAQNVALARDPSNEDPTFTRVRVRSELLPALLREDAQALAHLAGLADDARDALLVLEPIAADHVTKIMASRVVEPGALPGSKAGGMFDLSCLLEAPRSIRRLALKSWLNGVIGSNALTRAHIEGVEHALERGGEVWLPSGWTALGSGDGHLSVTIDVSRVTQ